MKSSKAISKKSKKRKSSSEDNESDPIVQVNTDFIADEDSDTELMPTKKTKTTTKKKKTKEEEQPVEANDLDEDADEDMDDDADNEEEEADDAEDADGDSVRKQAKLIPEKSIHDAFASFRKGKGFGIFVPPPSFIMEQLDVDEAVAVAVLRRAKNIAAKKTRANKKRLAKSAKRQAMTCGYPAVQIKKGIISRRGSSTEVKAAVMPLKELKRALKRPVSQQSNQPSYNPPEFEKRCMALSSGLTKDALNGLHGCIEGFARNIVNQAAQNVIRSNRKTITASDFPTISNDCDPNFSFDAPIGLVHHLKKTTKALRGSNYEMLAKRYAKDAKVNAACYEKMKELKQKDKDEKKKRRLDKKKASKFVVRADGAPVNQDDDDDDGSD